MSFRCLERHSIGHTVNVVGYVDNLKTNNFTKFKKFVPLVVSMSTARVKTWPIRHYSEKS